MGFTPRQIGEMSLWEFTACTDGYARANGAEETMAPPTEAEFLAWKEREGL